MKEITDIISTVGFPIACTLGLGWFVYILFGKMMESNREDKEKMYEVNKEDKERLYKEISYNREVNQELLETNRILATDIKKDVEDIKIGIGIGNMSLKKDREVV
ncbi:hypothetical protein HAHI6034_04940 [Hathewaya histolytica]|uniref:Uncharacterized protein n=1 Tax=Hathewaya histolytica TaxID=1498 RepID=A0A4U9R8A6_HATHI|nr:hypothetical protein [Hathewaya histolytica]VTQ87068.1 Uncharacterised protein [Hathewaya histolytica]